MTHLFWELLGDVVFLDVAIRSILWVGRRLKDPGTHSACWEIRTITQR